MRPPRLEIGAGAAFGFAAMCLFLTGEELLALLLPVTVHELGHLVAMLAMGFRPQSFRAEPGGFQIAYSGEGGALALVGLSLLFHALRQAGLVKMRKIR